MARQMCKSTEFIWWCATILFVTRSASQVQIAPEIDGIQRTLDLRLNTDLIPVGYKQRTQYEGYSTTEIPQIVELCHYQGSLRGAPGSWAAVSTCRGLRGVIYDARNLHYIHPHENTLDTVHYLYKHSDLISNRTCSPSGDSPNSPRTRRALAPARGRLILGPYNANSGSRYLELAFVVDQKIYAKLGSDIDEVHRHIKDLANIINALYTPLNVFVALVGIEVWTQYDKIPLSPVSARTLESFMEYRRRYLLREIPNDNSQLLTGIRFDGGIVGKAGVGSICTFESSGGVNMDHSTITGLVAATVAHEIGHNFGMSHDAEYCQCPETECIMNAALTSKAPVHWSSCSLEQLSLGFSQGMDYCLRNRPARLFEGGECGNGFVESGEDCDCGLEGYCDNKCCDARTCRFTSNAACATGECCDLTTCQLKKPGVPCRTSSHECDLPEYCPGNSEYCPEDVHKIDGHPCKMGRAFCYRGACKTHDDQCKLLWGPSGISSGLPCYELNVNANVTGNCGYNPVDSTFRPCRKKNTLCGRLQCKHLGAEMRFQFGSDAFVRGGHTYVYGPNYSVLSCKIAIVDLGTRDVDPGLVPNGAKCAEGRMCVDQKCLTVENFMKRIDRDLACLNNCSGNGVCNSLGRCHCDEGFGPPDCTQRGLGGSQDSGPPDTVDDETNGVAIALCIIFLGILPLIAVTLLCIWYKRNRSSSIFTKMFLSTYVSAVKCFERVRGFFTSERSPDPYEGSPKVFTISDRVPGNGLTITKTNFVSTTNPGVIRSSKNIRIRHSAGADDSSDVESVVKSNSRLRIQHSDEIPSRSTPRELSSEASPDSECLYESNSEIYVAFKKLSPRGLEKPTGTPENADSRSTRSFYRKKPPPPPIL
ncbi:disintegrin and metalloproteinase domain-containing protein 28 isoform X2 [Diachasma alloeum]|uniref:disintegrin and metalloproteinase domain-containing protein 28 isoform X2 n=1 Tax=Diachasma alloeum TaxID=454923 RepID=UPI0007384C7B|nr:disintegrin and metalloproteinase domain-containing protein 28 isoform X2 [Diachasma alloeum]